MTGHVHMAHKGQAKRKKKEKRDLQAAKNWIRLFKITSYKIILNGSWNQFNDE